MMIRYLGMTMDRTSTFEGPTEHEEGCREEPIALIS